MAATPIPRYPVAPKPKPKPKPPTVAAPKPVRSFDPYGASADDLSKYMYGVQTAGPDYSQIEAPDFGALQTAALMQAQQQGYANAKPIQDERGYQAARQKVSSQAAANFAAAFGQILGGGNANPDDPAAQKYALENFGGSYLGGMAASMGAQLIAQQSHSFDAIDAKLAGQYADAMDEIPGLADKIYNDLAGKAQEWLKDQRSIADADYKTQISALASLIKNKRDSEKAAAKTSGSAGPRIFQGGGKVVAIDPVTGEVVWQQTVGTSSKSGGGSSSSGGGKKKDEKVYGNSTTGYYFIRNGKKIPIEGTGTAATSPSATGPAATNAKGGKIYPKGTAYDVLNDLSVSQQGTQLAKWKKLAQQSAVFAKNPANKSGYQDALKGMMDAGVPLDIAQAALNKLWRTPGKGGRPLKSFQERQAAKGKNVSYSIVTPKTGIVTSKAWKGTHVTDNLGWGTRTAADIMGRPGTPVGAPEDGTIVRWGSAQGGQSLYFQGVSGKTYWLGHIDDMLPAGTRVRANQRIAAISADHANPHLHIDVQGRTV